MLHMLVPHAMMMSGTAKATCWIPFPQLSSTNLLICDSRKNGRSGSFVANFTPLSGSHITIERRPEPPLVFAFATSAV